MRIAALLVTAALAGGASAATRARTGVPGEGEHRPLGRSALHLPRRVPCRAVAVAHRRGLVLGLRGRAEGREGRRGAARCATTSSTSSGSCGRSAFRSGACSRSPPTAATTTRRWPRTTRRASTAASSTARTTGRCTPTARRSTSTPVENPYVRGSTVKPPAGRAFLDRSRYRKGMAMRDGVLVRAFASVGWKWGASFGDYQHFSTTGR